MPKKQKDGRYRSHIKIGVGPDGRDILKYISGSTRAELEKARKEAVARYIDSTALADDILFGEYATRWYRTRVEGRLSASSIRAYRSTLNHHLFPALSNRRLRSITTTDLQEIVNRFAGVSSTLIGNVMTILRGVFRAALGDRIISLDPTAALTRPAIKPPAEKRSLTRAERTRIEQVIRTHEHGLYLGLMYYLGLRPGEARGLKWGDLDLKAGAAHIVRDIDYATGHAVEGELKTKRSRRTVPIPDVLLHMLRAKRGLPQMFVAEATEGGALPISTARRWWVSLMRAAGLAHLTHPECRDSLDRYTCDITPHTMRHAYITRCWEAGLDPYTTMRLVGHTDIRTTLNIYTHLSDAGESKARERVNAMFDHCK